jgi:hypothetical protein
MQCSQIESAVASLRLAIDEETASEAPGDDTRPSKFEEGRMPTRNCGLQLRHQSARVNFLDAGIRAGYDCN